MSFSNENQALISLGASQHPHNHPHQQPLREWPRVPTRPDPMRPRGDGFSVFDLKVLLMSQDAYAMRNQVKGLVEARTHLRDYEPQLGWNQETGEPTLAIKCYAPGKQNPLFSYS